MKPAFTWLHISDLHAGIEEQGWLWPNLKHLIIEDLKKVEEKSGPWNVVIFSGDIAQAGTAEDFKAATSILRDLWATFQSMGFSPKLLIVPGNHDLRRPAQNEADTVVLKRWWEEDTIRTEFWKNPDISYRRKIDEAFNTYTKWKASLKGEGIELADDASNGLLPGDFATTIPVEIGSIGIVGLNSAWLQLGDENYQGQLDVDVRQINAVTNNDPGKWKDANLFNLLVTHHPADWLHPSALANWKSEICPPGRFDLHLFGHMHKADAKSTTKGGGASIREYQSASLFGLERIKSLNLNRSHGYAVGQLQKDEGGAEVRIWPRTLKTMEGGYKKLIPDYRLDLDEDGSFKFQLSANFPNAGGPENAGKNTSLSTIGDPEGQVKLDQIRYFIPQSKAAQNVRLVEQTICINAFKSKSERAIWLGTDWGAGPDGFVSAIQAKIGNAKQPIYRLDGHNITGATVFNQIVASQVNLSLREFAQALSDIGPAYLIISDINIPGSNAAGSSLADEIETTLDVLLDYCPELKIFLQTRRLPTSHRYHSVELKPLDEAEVQLFVRDHDKGGPDIATPANIEIIQQLSDGSPERIELALRNLEVSSIDDLASANIDIVHSPVPTDPALKSLAELVSQLKNSESSDSRRSYDLLMALAAFPMGETLKIVKRFYGAQGLYPNHALELVESSLAKPSSPAVGNIAGTDTSSKILVVPRTVRDFVRSDAEQQQLESLNEKAAEVYFGEKWREGSIKPSAVTRMESPSASPAEITNAGTIILRLLTAGIDAKKIGQIENALNLGKTLLTSLSNGDHYGGMVPFARDLLLHIPEEYLESHGIRIKHLYARALRMTGHEPEAIEILERLPKATSVNDQQGIMLTLALAYSESGETEKAVEIAKEIVRLDKSSSASLQARAIIQEANPDSPSRTKALLGIQRIAKKRGAFEVVHNLALDRARDESLSADERQHILNDVLEDSAKNGDYYSEARAITDKVRLLIKQEMPVQDKDRARLISAYHFLFRERYDSAFNACHSALWKLFERTKDIDNLFSLFRHSSLTWRLRGDLERENRYRLRLAKYAKASVVLSIHLLSREVAYYVVRVSSTGGADPQIAS